MKNSKLDSIARRAFLQRATQLSAVGAASPFLMTLAGMGEAAAATANDYKALVCVFLNGGNDHANTIIPVDNVFYGKYQKIRKTIATPQDQLGLTTLNPLNAMPSGMRLALAPQLSPLMPLFETGKLGVQLNVGPLIEPTTLNTYSNKSVRLPPKLFSHNDQASLWQSNQAEGAATGWGGKMGDLMLSSNRGSTFTCISVSGNSLYLSGERALSYQISPNGAIPINGVKSLYTSSACGDLLKTLLTRSSPNILENRLAQVGSRSIASESTFTSAFSQAGGFSTTFDPANSLAMQLKAVAQTIAARQGLGVKRQVFYVSMGGFDNHDALNANHSKLLADLGHALAAFYEATVELGVADSVTTFTASDFGRTLASNGDGSDHGWGGHHFVLGGSVKGKQLYGEVPDVTLEDQYTIKGGRLIPTTSVDQMIARLARWFGVQGQFMPLLAPNLNNFNGMGGTYF